MNKTLVAKQSITINAPINIVWEALTNPAVLKQFMFGTEVVSDWKKGSPIVFKGVYEGKIYEDKGVILRVEPERVLQYSHFSPLSGLPDSPENYHTVTFALSDQGKRTSLSLSQDNNASEEEREHSEMFWGRMLSTLKEVLEK